MKNHNNNIHKIQKACFGGLYLQKASPGLCDPTESIEGIAATFDFQLQSTEAIGKFPVLGSKPELHRLSGCVGMCWVGLWLGEYMVRCKDVQKNTIHSIDFVVASMSCTEIASHKGNAFLFRYLLGRTLSIYTGVLHYFFQCLVPLKTNFGNLDMYKAFWTHVVWLAFVGDVRIQVTHVNLCTSLSITSQSRPV